MFHEWRGFVHQHCPTRGVLADEVVRVLTRRQRQDADIGAQPTFQVYESSGVEYWLPLRLQSFTSHVKAAHGGSLSSCVRIESQNNALRIAGQPAHIRLAERRTQLGHNVRKPNLMRLQHIHVPLDYHDPISCPYPFRRVVKAVQRVAFVKNGRLR
jgi:hypothetical protein